MSFVILVHILCLLHGGRTREFNSSVEKRVHIADNKISILCMLADID